MWRECKCTCPYFTHRHRMCIGHRYCIYTHLSAQAQRAHVMCACFSERQAEREGERERERARERKRGRDKERERERQRQRQTWPFQGRRIRHLVILVVGLGTLEAWVSRVWRNSMPSCELQSFSKMMALKHSLSHRPPRLLEARVYRCASNPTTRLMRFHKFDFWSIWAAWLPGLLSLNASRSTSPTLCSLTQTQGLKP